MAEQVVPINALHKIGLVKDTPAIALPPNAFSDVLNVRFNNGCVEKLPGEKKLFTSYTGDTITGTDFIHVAWWANPNLTPDNGYYIVVVGDGTYDRAYAIRASDGRARNLGIKVPKGGTWQHTVYQGGYAIILNNGVARPWYVLDATGNTDMTTLDAFELPGWDSYYTNETVFDDVFNSDLHVPEFDLGTKADFDVQEIVVTVFSGTDNSVKFSNVLTSATTVGQTTVSLDPATDTHIATIATAAGGSPPFTEFLKSDDRVFVTVRSIGTVQVRCGVIRAWGDVLVAGSLTEINAPTVSSVNHTNNTITFSSKHGLSIGDKIYITSPSAAKGQYEVSVVTSDTVAEFNDLPSATYSSVRYTILTSATAVRNQPGVVRVSDIAAAGGIPHNWNPYSAGVSTAEEFTLSTTGIIQDLVQMQGNLYVYTNNSIHVLNKTGNSSVPYTSGIVSSTHGALCMDAVHEFKGRHIVIGSDDIYEFSGHPANSGSITNERVRDYFFDNVSSEYSHKTFIVANPADDELWICFPNTSSTGRINEILIWNYVGNVFSRREMTDFTAGCSGNTKALSSGTLSTNVDPSVSRPIFVVDDDIFGCDFNGHYTDMAGNNYESYIERKEAPMVPEFDVETLTSIALHAGKDSTDDVDLRIRFRTTDKPGSNLTSALTSNGATGNSENPKFTIGTNYKTDIRLAGRLIHYRITDETLSDENWKISGIQLEVKKGGRR